MQTKFCCLLLLFSIFIFPAFAQNNTGKKAFSEGVITGKVSTPGNMYGEFMGKIDFSKPNVQEQMEAIMGKWTEKEMERYQADMQKAGMLLIALGAMPMSLKIWAKGQRAATRYNAMNFRGETSADLVKKEGMMFMQSSRNDEDITLKYTGDQMYKMGKQVLSDEDYDIVKTKETAVVAGYTCVKSVYTLKGAGEKNKKDQSAIPENDKAWRVDVWTSELMPKSLNFLHPLYVEEDHGIMKLLVTFDKEESLKLQYEFIAVENKPVTEKDLTIRQSKEVYDAGDEKVLMGVIQKIMSITMGMVE